MSSIREMLEEPNVTVQRFLLFFAGVDLPVRQARKIISVIATTTKNRKGVC